ncbi:hypothetical protein ACJX0J_041673, partial [Zea mays]
VRGQVLALRVDPATFTEEPEDYEGFGKWSALFSIDEMKEQIETTLHESPGLESFVERLVPSVVDFTLLHVSAVKSTILEVGNIELFELNEVLASQFVYYCSKLGWIVPKNPDLPLSGTSDTVRQVISRFLRIMLFIWILSSTVLVRVVEDEISYEGAKAKSPISLLSGLRRRSTAHAKFGPSHHERKESIGAPIKLDVEAHAHIQKHRNRLQQGVNRVQTGISLNTLGSLGYEMDYGWRRRIACSITLGQSSELEKLVVSSPKASTNPPNISLTAEGGSVFPVNDPIITITDIVSNPMAYCLAAMKSEVVNLIGENFMSGLKVVFDRERKVLGWKNFDCYSVGNSRSNLPVNPNPS